MLRSNSKSLGNHVCWIICWKVNKYDDADDGDEDGDDIRTRICQSQTDTCRVLKLFSLQPLKSGTLLATVLWTCTSHDTFRRHLKTQYCQQAFQST